jgi:hypothetical protein
MYSGKMECSKLVKVTPSKKLTRSFITRSVALYCIINLWVQFLFKTENL